jgi:hypothetical protein
MYLEKLVKEGSDPLTETASLVVSLGCGGGPGGLSLSASWGRLIMFKVNY